MPFWGWLEPEPRPYSLPQYFASSMLSSKKSWTEAKISVRWLFKVKHRYILTCWIFIINSLMRNISFQNRKLERDILQWENKKQLALILFMRSQDVPVVCRARFSWINWSGPVFPAVIRTTGPKWKLQQMQKSILLALNFDPQIHREAHDKLAVWKGPD